MERPLACSGIDGKPKFDGADGSRRGRWITGGCPISFYRFVAAAISKGDSSGVKPTGRRPSRARTQSFRMRRRPPDRRRTRRFRACKPGITALSYAIWPGSAKTAQRLRLSGPSEDPVSEALIEETLRAGCLHKAPLAQLHPVIVVRAGCPRLYVSQLIEPDLRRPGPVSSKSDGTGILGGLALELPSGGILHEGLGEPRFDHAYRDRVIRKPDAMIEPAVPAPRSRNRIHLPVRWYAPSVLTLAYWLVVQQLRVDFLLDGCALKFDADGI